MRFCYVNVVTTFISGVALSSHWLLHSTSKFVTAYEKIETRIKIRSYAYHHALTTSIQVQYSVSELDRVIDNSFVLVIVTHHSYSQWEQGRYEDFRLIECDAPSLFIVLVILEDEGTKLLQTIKGHSYNDTTSKPPKTRVHNYIAAQNLARKPYL
jgi:uncharacterized protein Veg